MALAGAVAVQVTMPRHLPEPVGVPAVAGDEKAPAAGVAIALGRVFAFKAPMGRFGGWGAAMDGACGEGEGREEESAEDGLPELHGGGGEAGWLFVLDWKNWGSLTCVL